MVNNGSVVMFKVRRKANEYDITWPKITIVVRYSILFGNVSRK